MGEVTTDPVRPIRPAPPGGARRDWGVLVFPAVLAITAGAAIACANAVSPVGVWVFVFVIGGWLITLCLHEFAHAAVALAGGDTSVRGRGYLTLNPLRYTNAAMTFVLPLIILAVGGVPLPGGAVLIEHGRLRSAVARAAVSAAGPLTNLLAGIVLALVSTSLPQELGVAVSYLGAAAVRRGHPEPDAGARTGRLGHRRAVPVAEDADARCARSPRGRRWC